MNIFLKAKHWQLFALIFGIPFTIFLFFFGWIMNDLIFIYGTDEEIIRILKYFPRITGWFMLIYFSWILSVTLRLQNILPSSLCLNIRRFKILFFLPLFYVLVLTQYTMPRMIAGDPNPVLILISLPFHVFSMYCIFHSIFFFAKTMKSAEVQREASYTEFTNEFFLTLAFPLGIWLLQPRVNALYETIRGDS